ncbi:MAG TPA: S41 family peptidase [Kofleriaceae bacterium]|nr:S41 family peptidase [Kofleriaceae bacterium]
MGRSRLAASHLASFLAGVVVATSLLARALPDRTGGPSPAARDRYATLDSLAQALSYILGEYVDEIAERDLVYAAIGGMVRSLDRHSAFLPPTSYQRLREDTEGEFGGVGFELAAPPPGARPPYPVISDLIADSPAARAGLHDNDRVVEVAGRRTVDAADHTPADRRMRQLGALLRGPAGTRIELAVSPPAAHRVDRRVLVRQRVKVPTVEWLALPPAIGYVAIRRFQEATSADCDAALRALRARFGRDPRALVLDLRGNPGGLYDQAVRVADLFLSSGVIVKVVSRAGQTVETETARAPGTWEGFPMIALIDQGSASAAEIVAAALQEHGRATVMGLPSFGKGSVQTFLDLADGSGIKLTTARYYTPRGRSLESSGIQPDIRVEAFEPELVTGGRRAGKRRAAAGSGAAASIDARMPLGVTAEVLQRMEEDYQLRVSYETARGWLKSPEKVPSRASRSLPPAPPP